MTAQKIIHISDLHIGKSDDEAENLTRISNSLVEKYKNEKDNVSIVITGDLVDDGQKKQNNHAKACMKNMTKTFGNIMYLPGNHDYGWNGNYAKARKFKHFKSTFYGLKNISFPIIEDTWGGNIFIGLNSMYAEHDGIDGILADGELGVKQLEILSSVLDKTDDRNTNTKVIVALHHHPFIFPGTHKTMKIAEKIGFWLKDGEAFMRIISDRVDVLLFGHQHDHLNFSKTALSGKYKIPTILSCGKTTDISGKEFGMTKSGKIKKDTVLATGRLAWEITCKGANVKAKTITL